MFEKLFEGQHEVSWKKYRALTYDLQLIQATIVTSWATTHIVECLEGPRRMWNFILVIGDSRRFLYTMGKVINLCKRSSWRGLSSNMYINANYWTYLLSLCHCLALNAFPCTLVLPWIHFHSLNSCSALPRVAMSLHFDSNPYLAKATYSIPTYLVPTLLAGLKRRWECFQSLCEDERNKKDTQCGPCVIMWPTKIKGKVMTVVCLWLVHVLKVSLSVLKYLYTPFTKGNIIFPISSISMIYHLILVPSSNMT